MSDLNLERKPTKITDSRILEVFLDSKRIRLLEPFLREPVSTAQAAKFCGLGVKKMGYWVERFMEYGLLYQVTPARSRQAATYTTTAPHFVVENLDNLLLREYTREQFDPLWHSFIESLCLDAKKYSELWDFHVLMDESGNLIRDFAPSWQRQQYQYDPQAVVGDSINTWALLPLARDDARELMSRLEKLLLEFVRKASSSPGAPQYLVHLGVVRREGREG